MQAVYNKHGHTVAWLSDKDIYDLKGNFIGFVNGHGVYNISSKFRGTLKQSIFRDLNGLVIAFMKGAKKVQALPSIKTSPPKPYRKRKTISNVKIPSASIKPQKLGWSKLNWDSFL